MIHAADRVAFDPAGGELRAAVRAAEIDNVRCAVFIAVKSEAFAHDLDRFGLAGAELFGYDGTIRHEPSTDADYLADNPNRRCPDIAKARRVLGFSPRIAPEEGVRRYLRFLKPDGARA